MWIRAVTLTIVLCAALPARADAARVLVVAETTHGARVSAAIRRGLLVQTDAQISLSEAGADPDVVLTVSATSTSSVTVRYWDKLGHTDVLSLPLPNPAAKVEDLASTLATLLLQRNVLSPAQGEHHATAEWDGATQNASVAQPPSPRTFPISLADFL